MNGLPTRPGGTDGRPFQAKAAPTPGSATRPAQNQRHSGVGIRGGQSQRNTREGQSGSRKISDVAAPSSGNQTMSLKRMKWLNPWKIIIRTIPRNRVRRNSSSAPMERSKAAPVQLMPRASAVECTHRSIIPAASAGNRAFSRAVTQGFSRKIRTG